MHQPYLCIEPAPPRCTTKRVKTIGAFPVTSGTPNRSIRGGLGEGPEVVILAVQLCGLISRNLAQIRWRSAPGERNNCGMAVEGTPESPHQVVPLVLIACRHCAK